jgi:adenylate cyclase
LEILKNLKVSITLITATAVLVTLLFQSLGIFSRIELASFDHRVSVFRSDKAIHSDIVIVLIDEDSLQRLSPEFGRFPWPRSAYGDVIDFFTLAGAQTVAFDILFTEQQLADALNKDDQALINATRRAGNLVHAMQILPTYHAASDKQLPQDFVSQYRATDNRFPGNVYEDFLLPINGLYQASKSVGYIEVNPDRDGVYRRIRLFNQFRDSHLLPALASTVVIPLLSADRNVGQTENQLTIGELKLPLDDQGNYLINPYGLKNIISIADVIESMHRLKTGDSTGAILNPSDFAGKLVFIGASAIGLLDVKATSLDSKEAGVFLHAYTASNILLQDHLTHPDTWLVIGLMILLSLLTVAPVMLGSGQIQAVIPALIICVSYYIAVYVAFSDNQVYPLTPVLFAVLLSLLTAYSIRTFQERTSRLKIRRMLGQYVSPRVLTEVIDNRDILQAEIGSKENLTVLFSDIRSFTNLSESLEASQVVELLNIYFSEMTDIIFEYEGTLDKFIGDAILAFWGAPIKTPDHALKAVQCAIDMSSRLHNVNRHLVEKNFPPIDIGIGIHSDSVILGNIGSDKKLDYTVIGDGVNLASRLEGLTRQYGSSLVISEDSYKAIKSTISCLILDRVRVKGRQKPVNLYTPTESFLARNNLALSVHQMEDRVKKAFSNYLDKNWQAAIKEYQAISSCQLTKMMVERCYQYSENEPEGEWDGVYTFTIK